MKWSDLPGWTCPRITELYDEMARELKPGAVAVECGVAYGKSLAYLASEAIRVTKKLRVIGVDPWVDDWDSDRPTWGANHADMGRKLGGPFNAVTTLMHEHCPELLEYVRLVRMPSVQVARMFDDGSVFFVFIDGSHHYEDVRADLAAWEGKIAPGGIMAGHDFTDAFPGVQRAVWERWGKPGEGTTTQQRGACWWRRY